MKCGFNIAPEFDDIYQAIQEDKKPQILPKILIQGQGIFKSTKFFM